MTVGCTFDNVTPAAAIIEGLVCAGMLGLTPCKPLQEYVAGIVLMSLRLRPLPDRTRQEILRVACPRDRPQQICRAG